MAINCEELNKVVFCLYFINFYKYIFRILPFSKTILHFFHDMYFILVSSVSLGDLMADPTQAWSSDPLYLL